MTIFIHKGDAPLSFRQGTKRGLRLFDAEKAQYEREAGLLLGSQEYTEWANSWLDDNRTNAANNIFNHTLERYRKAVARLTRYRLADGREELTEEQETGGFSEDGEPITETVVVQPSIEPLPLEVDVITYDEDGEPVVETVPNPLIITDDAERTQAQAVIDTTPQSVKDWQ